jgi:rare lipoprotein A
MQKQTSGKRFCKMPRSVRHLCVFVFVLALAACHNRTIQTGKASYYADKFDGRNTASGAIFSQRKRTAAHRTLPFGTRVIVINNSNGKRVKVTINDRGPFVAGRIIDLSKKAARKLKMVNAGVADVTLKYRTR